MIGYIQVYFKLDCGDQIAYAKYDSDFANEITTEVIDCLKASIKDFYIKTGLNVVSVETCSKEEYETLVGDPLAESHWSEEKIDVKVYDGGKNDGENEEG